MKSLFFDRLPAELDRVRAAAFPEYSGRSFELRASETVDVASYWDGGSRSVYRAVDLASMLVAAPRGVGAPPQFGGREDTVVQVPAGACIVEHRISMGKDKGLVFHIHPATCAPLLPAAPTLSAAEGDILVAIGGLKSGPYRKAALEWIERKHGTLTLAGALEALVAKGLLSRSKNGATSLTTAGRNARGMLPGGGHRYSDGSEL